MISLSIVPGQCVKYDGQQFVITRILNTNFVILENSQGQIEKALISKLEFGDDFPAALKLVTTIKDGDWEVAQKRFSIIRPIINSDNNQRSLIKQAAAQHGIGASTIYRWVSLYRSTNLVSSLVPDVRTGGKGKSRLSPELDKIIKDVIEEQYLNDQKKSVQQVCIDVEIKCKDRGIDPPHYNTLRHRIASLREYELIKYRLGKREARKRFDPKVSQFPDGIFPFSSVQIDHTKLDIIVVDEEQRQPIGRPWITLAIDSFSRMIVGFYVGFENPSAMSVGLCLAHAILPKEEWLAQRNIYTDWPCWGIMKCVHIDNAKEFRSKMLEKACLEYGIEIDWRPVKKPEFGGYIERMMGTLSKEIHALKGTTFSNIQERGDYESEAQATFTIKQLEQWLLHLFVEVYHNRFHESIKKSPLAKLKEGLLGEGENGIGVGLPPRILNTRKVFLDFMPFQERTIQDYGVYIDNVCYYSDTLRPWINSVDKKSGKLKAKQKFIFKRDPRDISVIYFLDPELSEYFPIPYRDTSKPAISVWEFNAARDRVIQEGMATVDEDTIFAAYRRMKEIESNAQALTKKAKRLVNIKEKQREHRQVLLNQPKKKVTVVDESFLGSNEEIEAFEDIDDGTLS